MFWIVRKSTVDTQNLSDVDRIKNTKNHVTLRARATRQSRTCRHSTLYGGTSAKLKSLNPWTQLPPCGGAHGAAEDLESSAAAGSDRPAMMRRNWQKKIVG